MVSLSVVDRFGPYRFRCSGGRLVGGLTRCPLVGRFRCAPAGCCVAHVRAPAFCVAAIAPDPIYHTRADGRRRIFKLIGNIFSAGELLVDSNFLS